MMGQSLSHQNLIIIKEVSSNHINFSDFNLNDEMLDLPKIRTTLVMVTNTYLSTQNSEKVVKNPNLRSVLMKFENINLTSSSSVHIISYSKDLGEMRKRGKGHVSIIFKIFGQCSYPLMSNNLD